MVLPVSVFTKICIVQLFWFGDGKKCLAVNDFLDEKILMEQTTKTFWSEPKIIPFYFFGLEAKEYRTKYVP